LDQTDTEAASIALGDALSNFDKALTQLRIDLADDELLTDAIFDGTDEWTALLAYKLVPHLAGEGCLIAAVAGGTNTGKSTVFNLLLGRGVSPAVATAAATRHPVLAANPHRAAQCLEGKLVPEFQPLPLEDPEAVIENTVPEDALFVAVADNLPDRLVLLDTPDVDSIDKRNWVVADNIRAAGDVLIAILTGEKYKDDRVVEFFRRAQASGRVVLPLMNKTNPAEDYRVARRQLDEFASDVGTDAPRFVLPHDFSLSERFDKPVDALQGTDLHLREYLESLDVPAVKRRVYSATVKHFCVEAEQFLDRVAEVGTALQAVREEFDARTQGYSTKYDPAPGAQVGGLFHEFVQMKRGLVRRAIGSTGTAAYRAITAVGKTIGGALRKRATLEANDTKVTDEDIRVAHAQALERITRDLARSFIESARNLREPAAHLVRQNLDDLDLDAIVAAVTRDTLRSESLSREFREHAYRLLETWWADNKGKRRALEALDAILALVPTAIAAPLAVYAGGVGVSETVVVVGPVVEQFVARALEYQFGDAMFDFLSPWKAEQQRNLEAALRTHLTEPCLKGLAEYANVITGPGVAELRRWQELCLKTS
jgi:hypothetical protein